MKVSISWLKELVDLNCSVRELINLLPLRSVSIKEVTESYIELDMKGYNRADLLCIRGIAYEVAAITGSRTLFEEPDEAKFVWNGQTLPNTSVQVEDTQVCPFFTLTKIEGLKMGPSSKKWVEKLKSSGIRPINNIADVTNLIMLEFGQPMHSFDADKVANEQIIVRTAKNGEKVKTLDGKERTLTSADLLITDPQKPIGIAGIMGGENTEITDSTTTILLEAAIFNPISIRKTTTNLGLPSEASKRFQHGLTKKRLLQALNAAIKMYESLGGKVTAITVVGDFEDKIRKITLTKKKLEDLVGVEFEDKQIEEYLQKLGFTLASQGVALRAWEVTVPYWRLDVNIEEDVIEEVARMYGYEKIPAEKVSESKPLQKEEPIFQKITNLRGKLVDSGLTEVQTYSFYSTDVLNILNYEKQELVKIANPISTETEYLRNHIWPNLVEVVGKNLRKGFKDIAIFEIGKTFNVAVDGNPVEEYRLAIALMKGSENPTIELYQIFKNIDQALKLEIEVGEEIGKSAGRFHPTRYLYLNYKNNTIGKIGEVHLRVLNKLGIEKRVAVLEIAI